MSCFCGFICWLAFVAQSLADVLALCSHCEGQSDTAQAEGKISSPKSRFAFCLLQLQDSYDLQDHKVAEIRKLSIAM